MSPLTLLLIIFENQITDLGAATELMMEGFDADEAWAMVNAKRSEEKRMRKSFARDRFNSMRG